MIIALTETYYCLGLVIYLNILLLINNNINIIII